MDWKCGSSSRVSKALSSNLSPNNNNNKKYNKKKRGERRVPTSDTTMTQKTAPGQEDLGKYNVTGRKFQPPLSHKPGSIC
jgi:hypothetical protein